ncbi:hypothetical protein KSP39_PZI023628 [Platanthera zijinensis]|uniref:Uncharacterized protein n=1 Tax=Platanthera zijinensis TaxID=2320716 RepID=A0AAP0FTV2_9ASPA
MIESSPGSNVHFQRSNALLLSFISFYFIVIIFLSPSLKVLTINRLTFFSVVAEEKRASGEAQEITMQHHEQLILAAPNGLKLWSLTPSPLKPFGYIISNSLHVDHKIPAGDTPYVRAKRVQLVEKDPDRAIPLFWAAINAGDRVDSALKDMAIVMKQQNRTEEAIEAIKTLRSRCSDQSQESLDNILLDLYKRCGRLDDQITLLRHKLLLLQQGLAFNGKPTKTARSQGRKFQVSIEQEATRLLGNLGWALMQKENYVEAEAAYRKALTIGPDNNKMCNLGICLMKQGKVTEAKEILRQVSPAMPGDGFRGGDSHLKAFERAQEMLRDLEAKLENNPVKACGWLNQARIFDALLGSSSIWRPQPCIDHHLSHERFADENAQNASRRIALNIDAPPFYSMERAVVDGLGNMKRTRPRILKEDSVMQVSKTENVEVGENLPKLPEDEEFQQAIVAAVLASVLEDGCSENNGFESPGEGKMGKRLRIDRDITRTLNAAANDISFSFSPC